MTLTPQVPSAPRFSPRRGVAQRDLDVLQPLVVGAVPEKVSFPPGATMTAGTANGGGHLRPAR